MIWEGVLKEKLEALGIQVRIAHFAGDSSYPVEYTLIAGNIQAGGEPTLDLAMVALIEKLLPHEPVLVDCPHCHGAHYTGQVCPLSQQSKAATPTQDDIHKMLAELDELELEIEDLEGKLSSTESEKDALKFWRTLKSAQTTQTDIKKQLERAGYQVLIDAEQTFRYSASREKPMQRLIANDLQ